MSGGRRAEVAVPADPAGGADHRPAPDAIAQCIATLEALRGVHPDDPERVAVERAAAHLNKTAKLRRRLDRKHENRRLDREAVAQSARAAAYYRAAPDGAKAAPAATATAEVPAASHARTLHAAPPVRTLRNQRRCYVCKQPFRRLHAFYHALCAGCAERNFAARGSVVAAGFELGGRRAIVTGGRVKIGFEVAQALLRAGARVTVTTRFPADAARRFDEACRDPEHRARLSIVGLDFLDVRGVMRWLAGEREPLDILINNAAQTVRRPPEYYARLAASERGMLAAPPAPDSIERLLFPDADDEEGKPLDLRPRNSWVLDAGDVEPAELAEVHVVNAIVPFLLATRLRPRLAASAFPDRYIVNVSAMEGVFAYANKQPRHPHTNMAKAALNMFTRTSAADYVRDGIYMNSVDTGWITQENPAPKKAAIEATGFCPPLDVVDGAARVIAPIVRGIRGDRIAGAFFKDYEPAPW